MRDGLPRLGDIYIRRFLWNLTHDEIDRKHIIKTTCTTQNCVNKDHLVILPLATPPDWDEIWTRMHKKTKRLETEMGSVSSLDRGQTGEIWLHES